MTRYTAPTTGVVVWRGSAAKLEIANPGTRPVTITGVDRALRPGQSVTISTRGSVITATGVGGAAQVDVTAARALTALPSPVTSAQLGFATRALPDSAGALISDMLAGTTRVIAHRGGGDEAPEHTWESYADDIDEGRPIEVSGHFLSGGVTVASSARVNGHIIAHHDATADRCTDATGNVIAIPRAAWLNSVNIDIGNTHCGAGWPATGIRAPLVEHVLQQAAGRSPVLLEAKTSGAAALNAFAAMLRRVPAPGNWIIWKFYGGGSGTIPAGHQALIDEFGLRPWMYLDAGDTDEVIDLAGATVATLGGAIGMPIASTDAKLQRAVATGVPVIAFEVRRRVTQARLEALGVRGMMSPQPHYLEADRALSLTDSWKWALRGRGEIPRTESMSPFYTLNATDRCATITTAGHSLLLGWASGPTAPANYQVTFAMRWATLPTSTTHGDFVLCRENDEGYENGVTTNTAGGYHFVVRPNNTGSVATVQLYRHDPGNATGTLLGALANSTAISAGAWASFKITVSPTSVTIERTDITTTPVVIATTTYRGPYMGPCTATSNQAVDFRDVVVTPL